MKNRIWIAALILGISAGAAQATTIIGAGIGNGDFEATEPDANGPEMYVATPHWYNAGYPGSGRTFSEGVNFTIDTQTYGSPQSNSRAGMPFQFRKQINDSGYVVPAAGITFDLSYAFGRTGGKWNGNEAFRTYIFTTTETVNANFNANGNQIVSMTYTIPQDGDVYAVVETNAFYTTTASDVGKTFYFGMEMINPDGENGDGTLNVNTVVYPRVDVITWTANDGIETPIPPAGDRISIINNDIGNGDFDDKMISGEYGWYQYQPHWYNLTGSETNNFISNVNTAGNAQPNTQCGLPWDDRVSANDTPYLVTHTGTIFRVSYSFGRVLQGWNGDERMRVILFTSSDPNGVDGDTTVDDITIVAQNDYDFPQDEFFTYYQSPWFYETTAADLGKTLYLGLQLVNPTGNKVWPRIDIVKWQRIGGKPIDYSYLKAVDIIGGERGDGNFEDAEPAATAPDGTYSPEMPFTASPNWFDANGAETEDMVFTRRNTTETTRSAMVWMNRLQVNNTGYEVTTTGEVFNLSYDVYAWGGQYQGDEAIKTFLFTTGQPVDGDLVATDINKFAEVLYYLPTGVSSFSTNGFYVTTESDIGKTFYYGQELINPTTPYSYPRVDNVKWGVLSPVNPAITNLNLSAWNEYSRSHGLTGGMFADTDGDGVKDIYEFAHGGNATNPADQGVLYMQLDPDGTASFVSRETTLEHSGITYTTEWTDNLVTGEWHTVWSATNSAATADTNYVDRTYTFGNVAAEDQLFFRSRLFGSANRPNILLILADDLGYNDVGFNGSTDIITPELDTLAASGTIFTSAYVAHPFCGPSRMALLSGRYPHEIGAPYNLPNFSDGIYQDYGLDARETTISTVLQRSGYYTGIMGKWHCGQKAAYHPNNRGFDEFYGFLGGGKNYFGPYIPEGGYDYEVYPQHNGVFDTTAGSEYLTDVLTDHGVGFIEEAATRDQPFFLFMSYNAPHTPLQAKQSDMDMFPGLSGDRLTYAGMVYAMDRGVGRLIDSLQSSGQYTNTLIVFLSDNGGRSDQGASNFPLRGNKGDTSEGGFRVPMFMHWPGVIPQGATFEYPVSALDFYPMFAHLGEAVIPGGKKLDGIDVLDDIINGINPRPGSPIYAVRYRTQFDATGQTDVGIRQDQWKALKWYGSAWKLYDLSNDIHEDTDVSTNSPANMAILRGMVENAGVWAQDHVAPLWFDSEKAELDWYKKGMPHYDQVFVLPTN